MSAVKNVRYFFVPFVFAFVLIYFTPSFTHRRDFDHAFFVYYKDPTPENATALRVQQRINEYFQLGFAAVGALVLVSLGYGVYGAARLANNGWKRVRGSNSQS